MDSALHWSSAAPPSWLAIAMAIAVVVHLAMTLPRRQTLNARLLVIALNVVCALCLWAFLSPPSIEGGGTEAVVLTPGATAADLELALRAPAAFALPGVPLPGSAVRQITPVSDLAAIRRARPGVASLKVLGSGLPAAQWRDAGHWRLSFEPPPAPEGFFAPRWPRRLAAGKPFSVAGSVHLADNEQATVHLVDPAGVVAVSAPVRRDAPGGATFALNAPVRASGRMLFELRLDDADGTTIVSEQLPVTVFDPPALRMLMLLSSPSFESRAAVSWARQAGTELALRTAISRDRYRTTFFGLPELELEPLTDSALQSVDLVVVDGRQWNALSAAERASLSRAVSTDGMGLLLMLRADNATPADTLPWPRYTLAAANSPIVNLTQGSIADGLLSHAAGTLDAEAERVLWRNLQSRPVAAWQRHGRGRLAITLVTDSYALVTAGYAADHARYWQVLLDGVARPRARLGFSSHPALPRRDWRVQLCAWGEAAAGAATLNGSPLPLADQPLAPGQQCGYVWPADNGWQRIELGQQTGQQMDQQMRQQLGEHTRDLFVFPDSAWRTARHLENAAATRLAAQQPAPATDRRGASRKPLPAWWFFAAFAATAGLLWLEQKTAGSRDVTTNQ